MKKVLFVLTIALLGACAPAPSAPTSPSGPIPQIQGGVSFYPNQAGLVWRYLPESATTGELPYTITSLGIANYDGQLYSKFGFTGRGRERFYFRTMGADGVRLHLMEESVTSTRTTYTPAILEYPSESSLVVGATWGGLTRAVTTLVINNKSDVFSDVTLKYAYKVVDKNDVNTRAGAFSVFRIRLTIESTLPPKAGSEPDMANFDIWFTPYVGEVRTQESLMISERNFK